MNDGTQSIFEIVSEVIDILGVLVIVYGIVFGTFQMFKAKLKDPLNPETYDAYREDLGRALLLCLEFLVAADIIRSVAITPSLEDVTILGIIILIRTFLSISMEMEVSGRWPWQKCDPRFSNNGDDACEIK